MKKMIMILAMLMMAVPAFAGFRDVGQETDIVVKPTDMFGSDMVSTLPVVAGADGPYLLKFAGSQVVAITTVVGISVSAQVQVPKDYPAGERLALIGVFTQSACTNSARVGMKYVINTQDFLTSTTESIVAAKLIGNGLTYTASPFVEKTEVELGNITGVHPKDTIAVSLSRTVGTNEILHLWELRFRYRPNFGYPK